MFVILISLILISQSNEDHHECNVIAEYYVYLVAHIMQSDFDFIIEAVICYLLGTVFALDSVFAVNT